MKKLLNIISHYQRIKAFYLRYERLLLPFTLVVGFLADYIAFTNIKIKITFTLLLIYWAIAGATIIFTNFYDADKLPKGLRYLRLFAPLLIQFTFGALLGSSLVFYWLSGALSVSWPIILIIALLLISNDIFRHYFLKPAVQISVYFFTTLSLASLILPFAFNSLSPWLFILAGASSIVVFCLYIAFLSLAIGHINQQKWRLFALVFAVLVVMNVLYFANIIPPIPLSLREAGLYHSLKNLNGTYLMLGEAESLWQKLILGQTLHLESDERAYFYTAIFLPAELETQIFHHWQYYDEKKKKWVGQSKLSFAVAGGRKEGYKGYSWQSSLTPGSWRIYVKNQRGQVLAKIKFKIERAKEKIELKEVIR